MIYKTEIIEVTIGDKDISLYQITNVDEVFDTLIHSNPNTIEVQDERIPYWTELWPAAIAVSQYIMTNQSQFQNKSILELASGLGLPSIVVGAYASSVTISDYIEDAVQFASKNWALNHPNQPAHFEVLDWRDLNFQPWPNIILASDIAYEKRFQAILPDCIKHWIQQGSEVVFTEPGRLTAQSFIQDLSNIGLNHHFEIIEVKWKGVMAKVNVFHFRPNMVHKILP